MSEIGLQSDFSIGVPTFSTGATTTSFKFARKPPFNRLVLITLAKGTAKASESALIIKSGIPFDPADFRVFNRFNKLHL